MSDLVRAELLKLGTTRVLYGLLAVTLALTAMGVVGTILTAGDGGTPPLGTDEAVRNVFGNGGTASLFTLVLGILVVSGEIRHGTITQTFLVTPRRARVVGAKLVAIVAVGAALGALASLVTAVVGLPWLAAEDAGASLLSADVAGPMLAVLVSAALFGVMGVGLGALIRNQVAAIVVALVWQFLLENLLVGLLPEVGRWLPQGAARALAQETLTEGSLLPPWAGGLVLLAYGLTFAVIGSRLLVRRDVT